MSTFLRIVAIGIGGLSALSVVLLVAAGLAALFGNPVPAQNMFATVLVSWIVVVLAGGFLYALHHYAGPG
jgi:hypothetical protein